LVDWLIFRPTLTLCGAGLEEFAVRRERAGMVAVLKFGGDPSRQSF